MQRQRIHRRLRDKIHSEEGFTLSETLMTVVLIGLITMAMAGGIVAAKNVYQRISLRADAQTLLATTVSVVTEDLSSVSSCDALQSSGSSQTEAALIQEGTRLISACGKALDQAQQQLKLLVQGEDGPELEDFDGEEA